MTRAGTGRSHPGPAPVHNGTGPDAGRWFFLSHARPPAVPAGDGRRLDAPVLEFFRDLCDRVQRRTGDSGPIGFFSLSPSPSTGPLHPAGRSHPTGPSHGADGTDGAGGTGGPPPDGLDLVERELATCRVFVPLCSPRYFHSEACGRELSAFLSRVAGPVVPVVPVVWTATDPEERPELPAPPVHPRDHRDDDRYDADGVYGLMTQRDVDDGARRAYDAVLDAAADRIVTLARTPHLRDDVAIDLVRTPSAFPQPATRSRLHLYVLAPTTTRLPSGRDGGRYGRSALAWNPYPDAAPNGLAMHMADLVRSLGYEPVLATFEEGQHELVGPGSVPRPGVLVIDPWALEDSRWRARLEEFDQRDQAWVGVVVAWDLSDPQTEQARARLLDRVNRTLRRRYARRRVSLRVDANVASTLPAFGRALSTVVQESATQYLRRTVVQPDREPPEARDDR